MTELSRAQLFRLAPGSQEAIPHGCICTGDLDANGNFRVERDCPVHGVEILQAIIDEGSLGEADIDRIEAKRT